MKSLLLIALLLTGCSTLVPVQSKFPDVPVELTQPCEKLWLVEKNTTKLSDVLNVVTENYGTYYDCSFKVQAWQEWYKKQKKIHDEASQ
jgi:hypothetical protein